jgi:NAD(P)-dependent dehydrogenase (short-subunit alcohol dehydrogenase family)
VKTQVEHLTRAAGKEFGERGISMSAIGPNPMERSRRAVEILAFGHPEHRALDSHPRYRRPADDRPDHPRHR